MRKVTIYTYYLGFFVRVIGTRNSGEIPHPQHKMKDFLSDSEADFGKNRNVLHLLSKIKNKTIKMKNKLHERIKTKCDLKRLLFF